MERYGRDMGGTTTSPVNSLTFRTLGQDESENGNTRVRQCLRTGRLICTAWGLGAWLILFLCFTYVP